MHTARVHRVGDRRHISYGGPDSRKPRHRNAALVWVIFVLIWTASIIFASRSLAAPAETTPFHNGVHPKQRNICLLTADFWGLPAAGGTATAFELLAAALADDPTCNVTLVGIADRLEDRAAAVQAHSQTRRANFRFELVAPDAGLENVTRTHTHEATGLAALRWLEQHQGECDIVHGHEWGGLLAPILVYHAFAGFRQGMSIVVQQHGGLVWSSQRATLPQDVVTLRIDAQEKVCSELADALVAPTRYMLAWHAQRGWKLPKAQYVLPNVICVNRDLAHTRKPVYRAVFFGRLEERKGLKMVIDIVESLPDDVRNNPMFELIFLGADSKVDGMPSCQWLEARLVAANFKYRIMANLPREDALRVIQWKGVVLALCTMVENAPYVAVEASTLDIPSVIFDVGGVNELIMPAGDSPVQFDPTNHTASVLSFRSALLKVLKQGAATAHALRPSYADGAAQWQAWHHELRMRAPSTPERPGGRSALQIYNTGPQSNGVELHSQVCAPEANPADTVLLLASGFLFDPNQAWREIRHLFDADFLVGVTFGTHTPQPGRIAFPTSPTWIVYEGLAEEAGSLGDRCMTNVPIMIKRHVFCSSYLPHARDFPYYSSWALSLMLKQTGRDLLTFPKVIFEMTSWGAAAASCQMQNLPDVHVAQQTVSNLRGEPQFTLLDKLLEKMSPSGQALADIVLDLGTSRGMRSWHFGTGSSATNITRFQLLHGHSSLGAEPFWRCQGADMYPHFRHFFLHPCVAAAVSGGCCGARWGPAHASFSSWFDIVDVAMVLVYTVSPVCGDGVTVAVTHIHDNASTILHHKRYRVGGSTIKRELLLDLNHVAAHDLITLSAYPGDTHDCDSVRIVEWRFWRREDAHDLGLG